MDRSPPASPARERASSPDSRHGTRIPANFTVTDTMAGWAAEHIIGVDIRAETARFADYWRARPGRAACRLDWAATWRNWMRRAAEQASHARPPARREAEQAATDALFQRNADRDAARHRTAGELP